MRNVMQEGSVQWSVRPAGPMDAPALATIVRAATKDQGRWPAMTPAEEAEWVAGFVEWSQETADGSDALQVVVSQGRVIGRIRIERDEVLHARWRSPGFPE